MEVLNVNGVEHDYDAPFLSLRELAPLFDKDLDGDQAWLCMKLYIMGKLGEEHITEKMLVDSINMSKHRVEKASKGLQEIGYLTLEKTPKWERGFAVGNKRIWRIDLDGKWKLKPMSRAESRAELEKLYGVRFSSDSKTAGQSIHPEYQGECVNDAEILCDKTPGQHIYPDIQGDKTPGQIIQPDYRGEWMVDGSVLSEETPGQSIQPENCVQDMDAKTENGFIGDVYAGGPIYPDIQGEGSIEDGHVCADDGVSPGQSIHPDIRGDKLINEYYSDDYVLVESEGAIPGSRLYMPKTVDGKFDIIRFLNNYSNIHSFISALDSTGIEGMAERLVSNQHSLKNSDDQKKVCMYYIDQLGAMFPWVSLEAWNYSYCQIVQLVGKVSQASVYFVKKWQTVIDIATEKQRGMDEYARRMGGYAACGVVINSAISPNLNDRIA